MYSISISNLYDYGHSVNLFIGIITFRELFIIHNYNVIINNT